MVAKEFLTLDDVDVKGKRVIVRVDINVPYNEKTGRISDSDRIRDHAKTIKELSDRGARVIVLAHQGRKGDPDCIPLEQHAELLTKHVGRKVRYVNETVGAKARERIRSLKDGEMILLENVRFLDEETRELPPEEHAKSALVSELAPLVDIYVDDAFSAAHRAHASLTGFTPVLPSVAGRVMEREVESVERLSRLKLPITFVLGGAKVDDCLAIMTHAFEKGLVESVLASGVLSELFLIVKRYNLGETAHFLEKKKFLELIPQVRELFERHHEKIRLPIDVAVEIDGKRREIDLEELPIDARILDIGSKTAKEYAQIISDAKIIVFKGPAGVYEKEGFEVGTKMILQAIANSRAYSLIGGGDTLSCLDKIGVDRSLFSHVSLGGGALVTYLSGESMPAIDALKKSSRRRERE